MRFFLFIHLFIFSAWAQKPGDVSPTLLGFINSPELNLSRSEHISAEHIINMFKLIEKGYVNQEVLKNLLVQISNAKHFKPFENWLKAVAAISGKNDSESLISICGQYITSKETLPLERMLERSAGNYCRERSLEVIGREIEKNNTISDISMQFIQDHLKFFLTRKNKKNFAFFFQSQTDRPEILKKLSTKVTTYSVQYDIVPSADVLKDMLINEQITHLIQAKGLSPFQHQNVFYAEFGKLIESGYRLLEGEPTEEKTKEHFKFLKNYLELNQNHLPLGLCLTRLNDFSKAAFRGGFKDLSREIFKYIIKKNVKDIHEDALFFYLWTYLSTDDYKSAMKVAEDHGLLKKDAIIFDARLRFWIGISHEKLSKTDEAIHQYETIVEKHPLSYYAIMSSKKLQVIRPTSIGATFYFQEAIKSTGSPEFVFKELDGDHISSLVRLRAWATIDNPKMMNLELKRMGRHSIPSFLVKHPTEKQVGIKSALHLINALLIQKSKNHLATFKYLYEAIDKKEVIFHRQLLEILYPDTFLDKVGKALKNDSLDPLVVLSLIRQESVFNPQARSPVGARGLMQIMPNTARRFKKSVRDKHLVDPVVNIELGTKYFKALMKRFDGNLVYVLAAYNAGETRVDRWKGLYFDGEESILKNIEAIPFLETRNYVKLIFRNIFFYKLLLEKSELTDGDEFNKIFDVTLGFKR